MTVSPERQQELTAYFLQLEYERAQEHARQVAVPLEDEAGNSYSFPTLLALLEGVTEQVLMGTRPGFLRQWLGLVFLIREDHLTRHNLLASLAPEVYARAFQGVRAFFLQDPATSFTAEERTYVLTKEVEQPQALPTPGEGYPWPLAAQATWVKLRGSLDLHSYLRDEHLFTDYHENAC